MYSFFLKSVIIHNKYNTKLICSTILQILTVLFSLYIIIVLFISMSLLSLCLLLNGSKIFQWFYLKCVKVSEHTYAYKKNKNSINEGGFVSGNFSHSALQRCKNGCFFWIFNNILHPPPPKKIYYISLKRWPHLLCCECLICKCALDAGML